MAIPPELDSIVNRFCADTLTELINPMPPFLYHYTTLTSLRAILTSGHLRATNVRHLNDATEITHAISVMSGLIHQFYDTEDDPRLQPLAEAFREVITRPYDLSNIFVLCFSGIHDNDTLLSRYGRRVEGASLCLRIFDPIKYDGYLVKVLYADQQLIELCKKCISKAKELYLNEISKGWPPMPVIFAEYFLEKIKWFAPMFKNSTWAAEQEWRMVFLLLPDRHEQNERGHSFVRFPAQHHTPNRLQIVAAACDHRCSRDAYNELTALAPSLGYPEIKWHEPLSWA